MSAALLMRDGFDVTIFERSKELKEIGAGIGVLSNGVKALSELFGTQPFESRCPIRRFVISTSEGKDLTDTPYEEVSTSLGYSSYIVPRSDLQRILLGRVPESTIRTGAGVSGVDLGGERPVVCFEGGESQPFDLVIGADGIKSVVRESLHGRSRFRYTNEMCYRGVVPYVPEDTGLNREVYGESGKRFGIHPISDSEVYFGAAVPGTEPLGVEGLRREFAGWAFEIPKILQGCPEAVICNPIYDMKPLGRWGKGNVTLLGDAAHPTTPNLGQGGNMALEDAVVLSHCLTQNEDRQEALRRYESIRIPRTSQLVKESRQFGMLGSLKNPVLRFLRNSLYTLVPRAFFRRRMIRQLTFDHS